MNDNEKYNLYNMMGLETHWASPDNPNRAEILRQGAFRAGARAYREFKRGTPGYCYLPTETEGWRDGWHDAERQFMHDNHRKYATGWISSAEAEKDGQP